MIKKFQIGDKVKLNNKANDWISDMSGIPFYKSDGLEFGNVYIVDDTCPTDYMQMISIKGTDLSYPEWCFDLFEKSNSGLYEKPWNGIHIIYN